MLDRTCSFAFPHAFPFLFFIHSVSVPCLFQIHSISVPYMVYIHSVLFCQRSNSKRSWKSFRKTRFLRTCLQECFQRISDTQLKLSPYGQIQTGPVTLKIRCKEDSVRESFSEMIQSNWWSVGLLKERKK